MLSHSEASIAQCRLNILSVLTHYQFPMSPAGIRVLVCRPDRIFVEPSPAGVAHLANLAERALKVCRLDRRLHGPTAVWTMRECVPFASMQITGHHSPSRILFDDGTLPSSPRITDRDRLEVLTWELDIDHANPEYAACQEGHQDLAGLFTGMVTTLVHGCEVAYPGPTNPIWIRKRLVRRGLKVGLVDVGQPA